MRSYTLYYFFFLFRALVYYVETRLLMGYLFYFYVTADDKTNGDNETLQNINYYSNKPYE